MPTFMGKAFHPTPMIAGRALELMEATIRAKRYTQARNDHVHRVLSQVSMR